MVRGRRSRWTSRGFFPYVGFTPWDTNRREGETSCEIDPGMWTLITQRKPPLLYTMSASVRLRPILWERMAVANVATLEERAGVREEDSREWSKSTIGAGFVRLSRQSGGRRELGRRTGEVGMEARSCAPGLRSRAFFARYLPRFFQRSRAYRCNACDRKKIFRFLDPRMTTFRKLCAYYKCVSIAGTGAGAGHQSGRCPGADLLPPFRRPTTVYNLPLLATRSTFLLIILVERAFVVVCPISILHQPARFNRSTSVGEYIISSPIQGLPASLGPGLGIATTEEWEISLGECKKVQESAMGEQPRKKTKTQLALAIAQGVPAGKWARTRRVPRRTALQWEKDPDVRKIVRS